MNWEKSNLSYSIQVTWVRKLSKTRQVIKECTSSSQLRHKEHKILEMMCVLKRFPPVGSLLWIDNQMNILIFRGHFDFKSLAQVKEMFLKIKSQW